MKPILFPCIVVIGSSVLMLTKRDAEQLFLERHIGGNLFLFKNASSSRFDVSLIVDRVGAARRVRYKRLRRSLMQRFAKVYDFTLAECLVESGHEVNNSELAALLARFTDSPSRAAELVSYLRLHPADEIVNAETIRNLWDIEGFAIPENQWLEQCPEECPA